MRALNEATTSTFWKVNDIRMDVEKQQIIIQLSLEEVFGRGITVADRTFY